MTRRTTGATRHTCVVTVFAAFVLLNLIFYYGWQVNFRNLCTRCAFCCFNRDNVVFFRLNSTHTHFLGQLTLLTTRHNLSTLFLLRVLLFNRRFAVQVFDFLLGLAFLVVTTTVTLTARLLLVTLFALLGLIARLLANLTIFNVLLLLLATVATVVLALFTTFVVLGTIITALVTIATVVAVITIATIVLTLTTVLLTLWFRFFWRFFRLLRLNFFASKHFFQRAEDAAQETRLLRLRFWRGRGRLLHGRFCRWFFQRRFRRGFRHDEGC